MDTAFDYSVEDEAPRQKVVPAADSPVAVL
jgi:hypothetical protein